MCSCSKARSRFQSQGWRKTRSYIDRLRLETIDSWIMNKALVSILLFIGLLLFITSPFAALASLMLVLLVAGLFTTLWTVVRVIVSGDTKRDSA